MEEVNCLDFLCHIFLKVLKSNTEHCFFPQRWYVHGYIYIYLYIFIPQHPKRVRPVKNTKSTISETTCAVALLMSQWDLPPVDVSVKMACSWMEQTVSPSTGAVALWMVFT